MRRLIPRIWVLLMISTTFAQNIDWNNFNSGLMIEVTRPQGKFTCTGVAVTRDLVVTAAHCLSGEILEVKIFTQAGETHGESWSVSSFELHPEYDVHKSNYQFDLARIRLTKPLPEDTTLYPIMKNLRDFSGQFYRVGFGSRNQKNLRTLITPNLKNLKSGEEVLELHDQYSYSGDSGGPVFLQRQGQMYLVAIHSTLSFGPEGKFSFNPLLSTQKDWIHSNWH